MSLFKYRGLCKTAATAHLTVPPPEHPLFTGANHVGILSGENPRFEGTIKSHDAMRKELDKLGLKYEETLGMYDTPERSFIVHGPTREQMYDLGKRSGQEAVIYSEGHPSHELLYTNGPNDKTHNPSHNSFDFFPGDHPPPNNWTKLPGHGYLRLHFDFDKSVPSPVKTGPAAVPPSPSADQPSTLTRHDVGHLLYQTLIKTVSNARNLSSTEGSTPVSERDYTIPEALAALAVSLRKKLDEHTENLIELRKRELSKNSPEDTHKLEEEHSGEFKIATKKNAFEGYGPTTPGLAKRSLCKGCGSMHLPGKHLAKEGVPDQMMMGEKPEVKVKVKVKVKPGAIETKKAETLIDENHDGDKKLRNKTVGQTGVLPGDKASKVIDVGNKEGGSDGTNTKLGKAAPSMGAPPPSGKQPGGPPPMPKAGSPKVGGTSSAPVAKAAIPPLHPGAKPVKLPGMTDPKENATSLVHGLTAKAGVKSHLPRKLNLALGKASMPSGILPRPTNVRGATPKDPMAPKPQFDFKAAKQQMLGGLGGVGAKPASSSIVGSTFSLSPIKGLPTPGVPMPGSGKLDIKGGSPTHGLKAPGATQRAAAPAPADPFAGGSKKAAVAAPSAAAPVKR